MTKRVLNVGHCLSDHMAMEAAIAQHFDVELVAAKDADETLAMLRSHAFDLVLVNRKLDHDYSDGIDIIRQIKADAQLSNVTVMLITNFSDFQQQAIAAGAAAGFGKQSLGSKEMVEKLEPHLA